MTEITYQENEFAAITAHFSDAIASISAVGNFDGSHSSTSSALAAFEDLTDDLSNIVQNWAVVLERDGQNRVASSEALQTSDKSAANNFSR